MVKAALINPGEASSLALSWRKRERREGSSRLCPDGFASFAVSAREGRKGRIFGQKKPSCRQSYINSRLAAQTMPVQRNVIPRQTPALAPGSALHGPPVPQFPPSPNPSIRFSSHWETGIPPPPHPAAPSLFPALPKPGEHLRTPPSRHRGTPARGSTSRAEPGPGAPWGRALAAGWGRRERAKGCRVWAQRWAVGWGCRMGPALWWGGMGGRGLPAAFDSCQCSQERDLTPLVSLAGSERSRGSRLCSWQPAVTFPSGNGEWTLGPDADPFQPAFLPELSHRHPRAGLRWEDDGALQTAVQ